MKFRLFSLFLIVFSFAALAPGFVNVALAYSGCGGVTPAVMNAAYEQQVVDLVNTERANNGVPPLKRVTALDNAARYHSADLGQDNYFQHDTHDRSGSTLVWVCGTWTRIATFYSGATGENIAAGYSTPQSAMNAWMNSSGHRANILSASSWEIGVGYYAVSGSTYYHYWTQDFGRRSNVYPLIINRDAERTQSTNVSIYIYGSWTQMRLKNDNGSFGAWQPFQASFNWTIAGGGGTHTVTAELTNGTTTVTTSDTIILDAPALGNVPDSLAFTYSTVDGVVIPPSSAVTPANTGNSETLNWSLAKEGAWFTVAPMAGATPGSFTITPTSFVTLNTGAVTVTVTSPVGTSNSPKRINLTLNIIHQPFNRLHLPFVKK